MKRPGREQPREIELRKVIPNLMTAGAMGIGLASLHYATLPVPDFRRAVACIGASFVLDGLDGRLARLLRATSRFGESFDSIADFCAFGIAPAFVIYKWQLQTATIGGNEVGRLGLLAVVVYAMCAAIRLARFTRMQRKKKVGAPVSKFFMGLPAPSAAGCALVPVMLSLSPTLTGWVNGTSPGQAAAVVAAGERGFYLPAWGTILYMFVLSGLMVSTIPMISVKHIRINRQLVVPLMLVVAAIILAASADTWLTASALVLAYLLSFPFAIRRQRAIAAKEAAEAAAREAAAI